MTWRDQASQYMFFNGKGGVGKTSLACATAVKLADDGRRVLLVSTDPASNLTHVFETDIGDQEPTSIETVPGLDALNIDPEAAAQAYRDRIVGPVRGTLPDQVVRRMEEELSGACTTEIAAFDEFTALLTDPKATERYDHIIFDTAPTGHTLLLLDATGSYHRDMMRHAKNGTKVTTPMMRLQDPQQTKMLIVTLPETTPVLEAAALQDDLRRAGIEPWAWVVNASLAAASPSDRLLVARAQSELPQIRKVQGELAQRVAITPSLTQEPVGPQALGELTQSTRELKVTAKN